MVQRTLWEEDEDVVAFKEAAKRLSVSVATIRNWVKSGILSTKNSNEITVASINSFLLNIGGISKLNSRANKLQKREYINDLNILDQNPLDLLSSYERTLSNAYKNKEGIYYTPETIVSDMMNGIHDIKNKTFLEPCCGSGNFIIEAIKRGIDPKNIYAFDTDKNAVLITKKRIFEQTGYQSENVICGDFLVLSKNLKTKFDFIFTNPPWGKKISREEKISLSSFFHTGKSTDTSSLFLACSLSLLKDKGSLGFLLPDSFFNITTFEDIRKIILKLKIERIKNYGKIFQGIMSNACSIIVKNERSLNNTIICESGLDVHYRNKDSFQRNPKHIINFWTNKHDSDIIEYIYSLPNIYLAKNVKWGLGIVTGDNNKHCSLEKKSNFVPIYRGKDIHAGYMSPPTMFIDKSLKGCQQIAPLEFYNAKEKLIYRFISNKLVFCLDKKQSYILNSANLLIIENSFPLTSEQVCDLLNSDFMNWLFKSIFNTHKILRSDIELLPIYKNFFEKNLIFSEEKYLSSIKLTKNNGTYDIKK